MKSMVYKTVGGWDLRADVFEPEGKASSARPAIAFFHGGGWVFGSPEQFHGACRRYAEKGLVTVSFQYRLSRGEDGTYPREDVTLVECVKDARSGMRWVRSSAAELNVDPDRIAAAGQSAGGQLALSTALIDGLNEETDDLNVSPAPNAILLYASNYNTVEAWADRIFGERRGEIRSVSPYHNLRGGMPPVLAFHGRDDATVHPYTVEFFQERMNELGNRFELHWYPGRKHHLGVGCEEYAEYFDEEILERTDAFLAGLDFMPQQK